MSRMQNSLRDNNSNTGASTSRQRDKRELSKEVYDAVFSETDYERGYNAFGTVVEANASDDYCAGWEQAKLDRR